MKLSELEKKLRYAVDNMDNEVYRIIDLNKDSFLESFKERLTSGLSVTNSLLGVYKRTYNEKSVNDWGNTIVSYGLPKKKGQPYNFTWSGETLNNFDFYYNEEESAIKIATTSDAETELDLQYGISWRSLTEDEKDYIKKTISKGIIDWINNM